MSRLPSLLCVVVALGGCGHAAPAPAHGELGGRVAARVGDVDIAAPLVAAVAQARRVTPGEAALLLIDDAVAAKSAMRRGLDRTDDVRFATTAVKARATLDHLDAEAHRTPPSDDEVRTLSERHWTLVDAPETMVVVHAVARRPKSPNAQKEVAAKSVAAAILAAVAGAKDADDFQARAKAVAHPDVDVVVQPLEAFAADGRVAIPGTRATMDPKFAAAAATLAEPGATSGVVESDFGWHVIRLVERHPARVVPFEERRKLFAEEVYAQRGHDAIEATQGAVRAAEPVSFVEGVDEVLVGALPAIRASAPSVAPVAPAP